MLDHNLSRMGLILYDGNNLPFNDESFDVVCCVLVLHHLDNHDKIFCNHLESFNTHIPFNFLTDPEWRSVFNDFNLGVVDHRVVSRFLITRSPRQIGYLLEKKFMNCPV